MAGWAPTHLSLELWRICRHDITGNCFCLVVGWFFEYSKGCCNAHLLNAKLFLLSIPLPGYGFFLTPAGLWCQLGDWNVFPQRFAPNFSFDLGMKFQQVPYMVRLRHFAIEHLKMRISLTSWARKSCKRFIISPFIRPKIPKLGESLPGHKRNSLISFSNHSSHGITAWEMSKKQVPKFLCNLTWFWIPTKLILDQSSLIWKVATVAHGTSVRESKSKRGPSFKPAGDILNTEFSQNKQCLDLDKTS